MTYTEKLKDPKWKEKKKSILERDCHECRYCGENSTILHVHHIKYNEPIWDIDDKYLITLCHRCHEFFHSINFDFRVWEEFIKNSGLLPMSEDDIKTIKFLKRIENIKNGEF